MEDWRLCIDWLIRTDLVSREHRVISVEAELIDFVNLLRDGVLLCELANKLMPTAIDLKDYCHKPQMSQVGKINQFLIKLIIFLLFYVYMSLLFLCFFWFLV